MTTYTDTVTLNREEYDELCIRAWKFDLLQLDAEKRGALFLNDVERALFEIDMKEDKNDTVRDR